MMHRFVAVVVVVAVVVGVVAVEVVPGQRHFVFAGQWTQQAQAIQSSGGCWEAVQVQPQNACFSFHIFLEGYRTQERIQQKSLRLNGSDGDREVEVTGERVDQLMRHWPALFVQKDCLKATEDLEHQAKKEAANWG